MSVIYQVRMFLDVKLSSHYEFLCLVCLLSQKYNLLSPIWCDSSESLLKLYSIFFFSCVLTFLLDTSSVCSVGVTTRLQTATWLLSREEQSLSSSALTAHLLPAFPSWAAIPRCGPEPWMLSGTDESFLPAVWNETIFADWNLRQLSIFFTCRCRHWQDLGYLIIYVTGRPDMQKQRVVAWLSQHNFPHGIVSFCDGLVHDPLRHKANFLKSLTEVRLGKEVQ